MNTPLPPMPELSLALAQVLSMDPTPGPLLVNGRAPVTNYDGPFHIPLRPVSACAHCGGEVIGYRDLRPVTWKHVEGCEAWAQEQAFARSKQQLHEAAAALREDWLSMFSTLVECCEPPPYPPNPDLQALPWVQTPTGWTRRPKGRGSGSTRTGTTHAGVRCPRRRSSLMHGPVPIAAPPVTRLKLTRTHVRGLTTYRDIRAVSNVLRDDCLALHDEVIRLRGALHEVKTAARYPTASDAWDVIRHAVEALDEDPRR